MKLILVTATLLLSVTFAELISNEFSQTLTCYGSNGWKNLNGSYLETEHCSSKCYYARGMSFLIVDWFRASLAESVDVWMSRAQFQQVAYFFYGQDFLFIFIGPTMNSICYIGSVKVIQKWYFVTKIVLTYCEKKLF